MANIDPITNEPYPEDVIQRVQFVSSKVHVYQIPPQSSNKGHQAASWTQNAKSEIFTGRLRIVETAIPTADGREIIKTNILFEDDANGDLFAAVPYTTPGDVESAIDSSRFFAVVVRGAGNMKAVLGLGFEERPEAVDFSIALQEARKILGMDKARDSNSGAKSSISRNAEPIEKRDFSLKEGETITVNIGGKGRRDRDSSSSLSGSSPSNAAFTIAPPPGSSSASSSIPFLPPPPSASDVKAQRRLSRRIVPPEPESAAALGFDDGEFGEFQ